MKQYKDLLQKILDEGETRVDRTGVGTKAIFGHQLKFDLTQGFPLVSLKKTVWRSAFYEMIWFLRGDTNVRWLNYRGIKIWDEWADEKGDIGPGYGASMRGWRYHYEYSDGEYGPQELEYKHIDQLDEFVSSIKHAPFSRRHIMTTWHPGRTDEMRLPPCHGLVLQGFVSEDKHFDLHMYQRSCDTVLGLPFNIAEWAFFMHIIGNLCGFIPRNLIMSLGDTHIYSNHIEGVQKMLKREPKEQNIEIVIKKKLESIKDVQNIEVDQDVDINGYNHHPFIKFPVAV